MPTPLTIAVTGATGFVGRSVVRELLTRGHAVRALVRDAKKAAKVLGPTPALIVGDALDESATSELVRSCDACTHLIGIIREMGAQTFQAVHVGATRHMLAACKGAGVNRYVHMSALGVSDEGRTRYQKTKFEAEVFVRRSGLDWTIFRPALIHGPAGEFTQMAARWVRGDAPPYMFLPYFKRPEIDDRVPLGAVHYHDPLVAPVSVDDVAWCFAEALDRPETVGEIYNLAGSETLSWPDMLRHIRDHTPRANESLEPLGIPAPIAAGMARAASLVGLGGLLPHDDGMPIMGAEDSTATLDKVEAHFNFTPVGFRERFEEYAERL